MGYKNFRLNCVIRVITLGFTMFFSLIFFILTDFIFIPVITSLVSVYLVFSLIRYVETTNRHLTSFLESIRYSDFSRSFQVEGLGKSYDQLKSSFNSVITEFQNIRSEKEEHFHYLRNVVQHIGIALIAFQRDGKIELINTAAKRLFQIDYLNDIYSLEKVSEDLVTTLLLLKSGESTLIKINIDDEFLQLSVYATEFKLKDQAITLVSIQNIQAELEEQEMKAWQNLIRVLTHEIMNSITPISSLASTVNNMLLEMDESLKEKFPQEFDTGTINDIRDAINTIHNRSEGLIHFVESYRNLTQIPTPDFKRVLVLDLFQNIELLMESELAEKSIDFISSVDPESLDVSADQKLIEQVLINLIKNAIHATTGKAGSKITLKANMDERSRVMIQVIDNGTGILEDVLEKVFIPFFTTKSKGSGIGLSLSKQIMRNHGGTLSAYSIPNRETGFTLKF